VLNTAIITI